MQLVLLLLLQERRVRALEAVAEGAGHRLLHHELPRPLLQPMGPRHCGFPDAPNFDSG